MYIYVCMLYNITDLQTTIGTIWKGYTPFFQKYLPGWSWKNGAHPDYFLIVVTKLYNLMQTESRSNSLEYA